MTVTGDNKAAINFLRWLRPGGPWVLTAIPQEGGNTVTETFKELKAAEAWVAEYNGKQNLYFMVNPARSALRSKAKKEDVEALAFLHVDVDPPKGVKPEMARPRILEQLRSFSPPPSGLIDSGGGYQAFWRLDEALYIGGDPLRAADVEAYNTQLEILLGGDHCHNCDRIMRLPGTVNLPNAKKRAAGRKVALAQVVELTDAAYPLSDFTAAPKAQTASSGGNGARAQVKLSGNLEPVDLDKLPDTVHPRVKMLIVQGEDPDNQTQYGSRSEVCFAVCCGLIRGGCDDNTIASILLDKDFRVSDHIYNQRRPVEYAARQIQRAREHCVDPILERLNAEHAVIMDMGGKCRVISEVLDASLKVPRHRISTQSFEDFRNRYLNVKVEVGIDDKQNKKYAPAGHWWLQHPMRRQYKSLLFAPNREIEDAYNMWRGFSCDALPGNAHESYLEHLRENICCGNEEHYQYLIHWMARAVQEPGEQGEVAVVLKGGKGAGKGTAVNAFGSLWGRHYMQVANAKHLTGQFNAHLRDVVLLFADEAFYAGDKQHESILKTLITEDTMISEAKGVNAEIVPNYMHLMVSSNSDWVVPASFDERRFFILLVGEGEKQNKKYFAKIRTDMAQGGRENLLHHLLTMDLSDFEVRDVPQTQELQIQKMYSFAPEEQWWLERLMDGRTTAAIADWQTEVQKAHLQGDYLRYMEQQRIFRRQSPTALGRFLQKVIPGDYPKSVQRVTDVEKYDDQGMAYLTRERAYFYDLPGLMECRAKWEELYGTFDWPREEAEAERANRVGSQRELGVGDAPY